MIVALTLAVAQVAAGAWSTGRPPECSEPGSRAGNVWERAKSPELRRYCDLVASAASKLAGTAAMAEQAAAAAREADTVLPGHAAPRVLEGRALEALGKDAEALAAFQDGQSREPGALDDPLALLAWARVLARTGHADEAASAYRALLPRATSLSQSERSSAAIEAGLVAMSRGPSGLDEAVAALREGLRESQDEPRSVCVLALALALDRRGDADESKALLADRGPGDPRTPLGTPRGKAVLAVAAGETPALVGLALEATDPSGARDAWRAYVEAAPKGPWAAEAQRHLAALGKRGPAPARGGPR